MRVTTQRYDQPHRPLPLAWANQAGRWLAHLGVEAKLDEASLLATARRRAGLADFGDRAFLAPFRRLLTSIQNEAQLHPLGRLMVRENLLRVLCNRLRVQEAWTTRPGLLDRPLEDPVFIVGLQRTGTTLLHRLLACDPQLRYLASWEAINVAPLPPAGFPRAFWGKLRSDPAVQQEPRIGAAKLAERSLAYLAPDFFAIHPVEAEAPEEDVLLLEYTFYSTVPEATLRVPSYAAWLEQQDHVPAYRKYRGLLSYLQWQRPSSLPQGGIEAELPRWLLKTPHHLEHLDALLTVFPQARIIQTHRDPVTALASFCSMMAHGRGVFSDRVDPHEIGAQWSKKTQRMVTRALQVREAQPEAFFDVHYGELVADPIAVLRWLYPTVLGRELTPELEARLVAHRRENPQHKYGRHAYQLEDFGLDRASQDAAFAPYRERFGIAREEPRR